MAPRKLVLHESTNRPVVFHYAIEKYRHCVSISVLDIGVQSLFHHLDGKF
jgi:hypothetical protein